MNPCRQRSSACLPSSRLLDYTEFVLSVKCPYGCFTLRMSGAWWLDAADLSIWYGLIYAQAMVVGWLFNWIVCGVQ